jgi:hypothetical protein
MKAVHTSETWVYFHESTGFYVTVSCNIYTRHRENLKSHKNLVIYACHLLEYWNQGCIGGREVMDREFWQGNLLFWKTSTSKTDSSLVLAIFAYRNLQRRLEPVFLKLWSAEVSRRYRKKKHCRNFIRHWTNEEYTHTYLCQKLPLLVDLQQKVDELVLSLLLVFQSLFSKILISVQK